MKILWVIAALLLIGSTASLRAADLQTLEREFTAAKAALKGGDFTGARTRFESLVAEAPQYPAFRLGLARSLSALGENDAALAEFRTLVVGGFGMSVVEDPAFARLAAQPGFAAVRAEALTQVAPIAPARETFVLLDRRFIPESVAFDERAGRFLVGSTYLRKIIAREPDGRFTDFVGSGDRGLMQVLGLKADPVRNRLLVCTAAEDRRMIDFKAEERGRSGVFIYELDTGRFIRSVALDRPGDHLCNDLVVMEDAVAYVTDSVEGRVYRLDADARSLTPITPAGAFLYPNGITQSAGLLYVADLRGVFTVDPATGATAPIPTPHGVSTASIDGLYVHDGHLIGIQNGVQPTRIMAYRLSADGRRIVSSAALERGDPRMTDPTTGVVVGHTLYFIANSPLHAVDSSGAIPDVASLPQTAILQIELPRS